MTTHTRTFWYQKHEMLTCAAKCGFSVTESLFDDWVEKGLIGEAGARAWPGRGSRAWWPQAQLTLFLDLLALRQRTPTKFSLMQLCHLPVWRWLYWGDLGGVTLKQVKRAISTWIDFQQKIPEKQVRRDITHGMRHYQGPKATDKLSLIDELTRIMTFQKPVDRDLLQHLLDPVVYAYPKKTAKGPVRAFMDVAECWSLMHSLLEGGPGQRPALQLS